MTLAGYDIAGVNGSGAITTALKGAFVILKASEGQTFIDPQHDSFGSKARAAGKLVGHYHYGRPDTKDTADAVKEADHFVDTAKAKTGETMWLDFEKSEDIAFRGTWPEWVLAFCARVKARTGASCGVYLNDWFANRVLENATTAQAAAIRSLPFWKAGNNNAYVSDPSVGPGNLHGWSVLTCWQWTDSPLDQDIFYGTATTWRALGVGAPTTEVDMPLTQAEIDAVALRVWQYKNPDLDVSKGKDAYGHLINASTKAATVDVAALAAELAPLLPAVDQEDLEAALRSVLGSLDNQPSA